MQQHSAQHLITAIADSIFGFKTTSWWLGEYLSHIELGIFLSSFCIKIYVLFKSVIYSLQIALV